MSRGALVRDIRPSAGIVDRYHHRHSSLVRSYHSMVIIFHLPLSFRLEVVRRAFQHDWITKAYATYPGEIRGSIFKRRRNREGRGYLGCFKSALDNNPGSIEKAATIASHDGNDRGGCLLSICPVVVGVQHNVK
jgi:hypothetical protein